MPPLCLHLGIADEVARTLGRPVVLENLGLFLLGATSPDIRLITGASREDTHFLPLDADFAESSVQCLFRIHPALAESQALDRRTRAFVAGYVSHLITDDAWILDIYRPFFGKKAGVGDGLGNMMDRALQYELDRRERMDRDKMTRCQTLLEGLSLGASIAFFGADALQKWRRFVWTAAGREPSWDRFRSFAERFLLSSGKVEAEHLHAFLRSLPDMLRQTIDLVGEERLNVFRRRVVSDAARAAEEYLS
ncbi:MAG: zinc dependent phospholipase C family protein [Chloroflexi bacterium]|nr:zinc dependent phospholipase C family protein [Chloroflexota bacterium]